MIEQMHLCSHHSGSGWHQLWAWWVRIKSHQVIHQLLSSWCIYVLSREMTSTPPPGGSRHLATKANQSVHIVLLLEREETWPGKDSNFSIEQKEASLDCWLRNGEMPVDSLLPTLTVVDPLQVLSSESPPQCLKPGCYQPPLRCISSYIQTPMIKFNL